MQDVEDDTEDLEDLDTGTIIGRLGEKWSQEPWDESRHTIIGTD